MAAIGSRAHTLVRDVYTTRRCCIRSILRIWYYYRCCGNIYGDRFIITVTQDETLVHATVSVQKNPTDTSSWALASSSGSAINDTNSISITFVPNVPSMGIRAIIGLDYQIWNGGNEVGEGTLNDVLNRTSNTFSLTMTTVVHGGDNIVVYLSLAI